LKTLSSRRDAETRRKQGKTKNIVAIENTEFTENKMWTFFILHFRWLFIGFHSFLCVSAPLREINQ